MLDNIHFHINYIHLYTFNFFDTFIIELLYYYIYYKFIATIVKFYNVIN